MYDQYAKTRLYNTLMGNPQANNAIGRTAGLQAGANSGGNKNFFQKRWDSIENAVGTTGAAIASIGKSGIDNIFGLPVGGAEGNGAENIATGELLRNSKNSMNDIAKKYGYKTYQDVWDARDKAEAEGDTATLDLIDKTINPELQAQANANAKKADEKAAAYQDYMDNNYVSKKINQDQGKFAGSAINTLSTAVDVAGLGATPVSNAIQGGIEGVADELEQNGFENFDWGRAGQNAAIGATTGAVTGALNKGISNSLAKRAAAKGLTNTATKAGVGNAIKSGAKTIASGAARGALSGAVGGATGAGLQSAMNGVEFGQGVQNALQGAVQGAQQGAVTGGIMAGANAAFGKTNFGRQLQNAKTNWDQSGSNLDERLTNTLTSGDSAVGDWLMNKRQSNVLGTAGNLGNRVQDVSGITDNTQRKALANEAEKLIQTSWDANHREDEIRSITGALQNLDANLESGQNAINRLSTADKQTRWMDRARTLSRIDESTKAITECDRLLNDSALGQQTKSLISSMRDELVRGNNGMKQVWDQLDSYETRSETPTTTKGTNKYVGVDTLGNRTEYTPAQLAKLINEYDNYKQPTTLSGDSFDEVSEVVGPAGSELMNIYKTMNGGVPVDPYNRASWGEFESWLNTQRTNTPTTAKGWAKKAGQRIVEDINNSNLGNRIKDVSSDTPGDIRNMQINRNDMLGYEDDNTTPLTVEEVLAREGIDQNSAPRPQATTPAALDAWDRVAQEAGYSNYDEVLQRYAEANPNAKINPRGMAGQVLTWMDQNPNTPTTAAGWAKRAGQRTVEDINNSNLGLKVRDVSQDDPSKQLYNALAGNRQPVAETEVETEADMGTIPSKTSKESRFRYARGKELVAQYGTVDQPMARATNAVKTFQRISDMGFEDPTDVEFMANAITGSNGYVSTLNRNIIKSAKPVDTFTGDGGQTLDEFIDNSIAVNKLSGLNEGVAVKRSIDAYLKSLPSRAEGSVDYKDSAADTFKVVQGLEASAAELEGRGGSTYHRADTVDLHQAAVLKDVANLLKNRIYDGANAKIAITPQVVKEMKALAPDNEKWSTTVDDFAKNVKTPQDLRRFQEPFVKAGRYIDNQYVQAATVGGRMAANAGELPTVLRTTKAGIINDLVNRAWNSNMAHRGRAALYGKLADRAAEKATNNPTTAKGWAKQAGQRAAEDLGNTNLGNRIQDVSGGAINAEIATPADMATATANYNPSTQLYNAIGRTEGLTNAEQARTANYLADAAQEAEIVPNTNATNVSSYPDASATSLYNTMYGTPTATQPITQASSTNTGYFQPTGDYWTDVIASAMTSAIDADDVTAFATLYGMYQDQLANLQKQASSTSSNQQKLSATQQRANAAMNSLERLSQMTPDMAYNLSGIPLVGGIATLGGNDYEAEAKSLAQQIGYMVSGSNIKDTEAENIGKSYVPQPWDNEQVRQNKLRRAREIIQQYQNGYIEA